MGKGLPGIAHSKQKEGKITVIKRKSQDISFPPAKEDLEKVSPLAREIAESLVSVHEFLTTGRGGARETVIEVPDPSPRYTAAGIREIRKRLGMTQAVFSRLVNVSVKSVEGWETGRKSPGPASRRLLQILDDEGTLEIVARLAGYRLQKVSRRPPEPRAAHAKSKTRKPRPVPTPAGKP